MDEDEENPWATWHGRLLETPVLFINMDRSKKRRARVETILAPFMQRHRVPGVDANIVIPDAIHDERIDLITRARFAAEQRRWNHWELDNKRSAGASLAHMAAWRYMLDHDIPLAMVVEDNIETEVPHLVTAVEKTFREHRGAQLFRPRTVWTLGASPLFFKVDSDKEERDSHVALAATTERWIPLRSWFRNSCYMLSRPAARVLLANALPIQAHIEFYMGSLAAVGSIDAVAHSTCFGKITRHTTMASTIMHDLPMQVIILFIILLLGLIALIAFGRALWWRKQATDCFTACP